MQLDRSAEPTIPAKPKFRLEMKTPAGSPNPNGVPREWIGELLLAHVLTRIGHTTGQSAGGHGGR